MRILFSLFTAAVLGARLASAVTYSNFPTNLQSILDQRLAAFQTNTGFCIAGHVTFNDGAHIGGGTNVLVNFENGLDDPLLVYSNGWFIGGRIDSLGNSSVEK